MSTIKTLNRITRDVLKGMTDAQLTAIAETDPHDLSEFTDHELNQIVSDTASPDLLRRVALTRKNP